MIASGQEAVPKDRGPVCKECHSPALRPVPKSFLDWLSSAQPYKCDRCAALQVKSQRDWSLVIPLLLLYLVIPAAVFFASRWFLSLPKEATAESDIDMLTRTRSANGQLSTFEQMLATKPKSTLNNELILKLWDSHLGTDVILQMIHTSIPDFDVSPDAVIRLHQANVDERIILAMIESSYATK